MSNPSPLVSFPDLGGLTDRQMLNLLLYELVEAKAEIRALTSLVLQMENGKIPVSFEAHGKTIDEYQDDAIRNTAESAKAIAQPPTRPDQN